MNTKFKSMVKVIAIAATMGAFASGCGSKTTTTTVTKNGTTTTTTTTTKAPAIVFYGGYYGYYYNTVFCDWANNYCGTSLGYGIYNNGLAYGGYYYYPAGSTGNWYYTGGSSGTIYYGSTGGVFTTGSTGGTVVGSTGGTTYTGSTGGTVVGSTGGTTYTGSTGSTYTGSTGSTYTGSTGSTYTGSTGSTYTGSTGSTYTGSTGSTYSGSTGSSYSGSTGSYSGSTGSGYSFNNDAVAPVNANTLASSGCTDLANCVAGASQYGIQAANLTDSVDGSTRDTDLQQADLQQADVATRAQSISTQFQMNYTAAVQLTQLADKVQSMTKAGSMTSEDREAITESALSVAGIGTDDVNTAIAATLKGDATAMNSLMDKAATNLGMPSSAGLREKILPALGINI